MMIESKIKTRNCIKLSPEIYYCIKLSPEIYYCIKLSPEILSYFNYN